MATKNLYKLVVAAVKQVPHNYMKHEILEIKEQITKSITFLERFL